MIYLLPAAAAYIKHPAGHANVIYLFIIYLFRACSVKNLHREQASGPELDRVLHTLIDDQARSGHSSRISNQSDRRANQIRIFLQNIQPIRCRTRSDISWITRITQLLDLAIHA
jgi:hypothetical protein